MITRIATTFARLRNASRPLRFATRWLGEERSRRISDGGFTLLEMVFAVEVMLLLTLISFNETTRLRKHAEVAACLRYQAIIQRQLWAGFALDGNFPGDIVATLNSLPRGALDKLYDYAPNGPQDQYYMRCGHDHSYVGVLFVDSGAYLLPKPIYALAAARGAIP